MDRTVFKNTYKQDDKFRPLTEEGKLKFLRKLKKLKQKKVFQNKKKAIAVYYSPFTRTKESAELFSKKLKLKIQPLTLLEHGQNQNKVVAFLKNSQSKVSVIIGHEPELSRLLFILRKSLSGKKIFSGPFKKGEARFFKFLKTR